MFIKKLEIKNYEIGSFNANYDNTVKLIAEREKISIDEAKKKVDGIPHNEYTSSIQDKDGNYVGYIYPYNIDMINQFANIMFDVIDTVSRSDKMYILMEYKLWLNNSVNILYFENIPKQEKNITKYKYIKEGLPVNNNNVVNSFKLSELKYPHTIKYNDGVLGVIGLYMISCSDRSANMEIILATNVLDTNKNDYILSQAIDEYLDYTHFNNIYNVEYSIRQSDTHMIDIINCSKLTFCANIPLSSISGDKLESTIKYQHTPETYSKRQNEVSGLSLNIGVFNTKKKKMSGNINLKKGYYLVSPSILNAKKLKRLCIEYAKSFGGKDSYASLLGKDKFIPEFDNEGYSLYDISKDITYYILDKKTNSFCGYLDIIKTNANNKNAEIEIGVIPRILDDSIGKMALERFYEELFSIGYASVTSIIYDLNKPAINMQKKLAKCCGYRYESYYAEGRLWNTLYYTKLNPILKDIKEQLNKADLI